VQVEGLDKNGLLAGYTHLLTGYIGSVSFVQTIARVLARLRAINPDIVYVCDPGTPTLILTLTRMLLVRAAACFVDRSPARSHFTLNGASGWISVLGDEGKLYVPDDLVAVYREDVVALATILTPNQFECELLSGLKVTTEPEALVACDALHARGPQLILLTSCSFGDSKALTVGHCRPFG
jgi:pyridoxine kinase